MNAKKETCRLPAGLFVQSGKLKPELVAAFPSRFAEWQRR
jgi:hypothetical protein